MDEIKHENIEKQTIPDDYKGPPIFCSYTTLVPVDTLKPNPKNPNKHPRKQISLLQKVLSMNGWRAPIVVSNLSGLIVKGEGRWTTAIQAGWSHVPVDFQDYLSPELEEADLIADNELALLAEMDKKKRLSMLEDLNTGTIDLEVTGIPMAVLEEMFNESRKEENKALFPMAAQLHERYGYVLIFTDNETDEQFLREFAGARKEVSYKMTKEVGIGRSIPFGRFMENLKKAGYEKVRASEVEPTDDE